jgi:hypothetical protein
MNPRRAIERGRRLGSAELMSGTLWIRLSRTVDPSRKRIRLDDPTITTLEQGRACAHRMSVAIIEGGMVHALAPLPWPASPGIYFVRAGSRLKIGSARNVAARLREIQTSSPIALTLLAVAPGGRAVEASYHARFVHLRVRGEWFRLGPDLCAEIAAIRGM